MTSPTAQAQQSADGRASRVLVFVELSAGLCPNGRVVTRGYMYNRFFQNITNVPFSRLVADACLWFNT